MDANSDKPAEPKGVIAILTGPDGYVWATGYDFETSAPGGFSMQRAQELRADQELACKLISATCNANIAEVIPQHVCQDIVANLIRKKGWRRTIKYIGYNKEGSDK